MITYDPFWKTIKRKKISTYALIHKYGISNSTLYRMRKGRPITTETLNQLCIAVNCRVEDVILFIEESDQF